MGKTKRLVEEHDEAIFELAKLLSEAHRLYMDSTISAAEFVGNLELAKYMVLAENHRRYELDATLGDLLENIFGGEEGED